MNLTNSCATFGLTTKATPTPTAVNGTVQIDNNPQVVTFPDVDVDYSVRAFFALGRISGCCDSALNPPTG